MDLVSRLKLYLNNRGISVTQFADECDIPRPTASQLLAGRNKKVSDEIIGKIHYTYPGLSITWLMFGEGEMLNSNEAHSTPPSAQQELPNVNPRIIPNAIESTSDDMEQSAVDNGINHRTTSAPTGRYFHTESPQPISTTNPIENNYATTQPSSGPTPFPSHQPNPLASHYDNSSTTFQPAAGQAQPKPQSPLSGQHIGGEKEKSKSTFVFSSGAPDHDEQRTIRLTPDVRKSVVGIVVYYNDNTYESFIPDPDGKHPFMR